MVNARGDSRRGCWLTGKERQMLPNAYWFFDDLVTVHITGDETEGRSH